MTRTNDESPTVRLRLARRAAAWFAVLAVVGAPLATASAQSEAARERARTHYIEGKNLFATGDYRAAIGQFEAADRLSPAPLLSFNIGLAYEQLGEGESALRHYRSYLQRLPSAGNRSAVEDKIRRLEAEVLAARKAEQDRAASAAREAEEARHEAARRAAEAERAEAERRAAEDSGEEEPDNEGDEAVGDEDGDEAMGAAGASPDRGAPAGGTGDPLLDRAGAIDVAAIRDQRSSLVSAPAAAGGQTVGTTHENFGDQGGQPKSKPAYKQWWFWAVVGVSAIILVDILSSDSAAAQSQSGVGASSGAVLLRF